MTQPDLFSSPVSRVAPAENPVAREQRRLNAAARRVLAFLQAHGSATNVQLCRPECGGMRAVGGRLFEIRRDGWLVETKHVRDGLFKYTLKGRKDQI